MPNSTRSPNLRGNLNPNQRTNRSVRRWPAATGGPSSSKVGLWLAVLTIVSILSTVPPNTPLKPSSVQVPYRIAPAPAGLDAVSGKVATRNPSGDFPIYRVENSACSLGMPLLDSIRSSQQGKCRIFRLRTVGGPREEPKPIPAT